MEKDMEWINGISPYFKILEKTNNKLIQLINELENNEHKSVYEREELFFETTTSILRLLPYKIKGKQETIKEFNFLSYHVKITKNSKINNEIKELKLEDKTGMLLLNKYFNYIKLDFNKILINNRMALINILLIRNKYIHEPHNIKWRYTLENDKNSIICFVYKKEKYKLESKELIKIVMELNEIFIKIQTEFNKYFENKSEEIQSHPYVKYILGVGLNEYNNNLKRGM